MFLQILKNDMLKRKGVNSILFLFITLATVFLASSFNNILVVSSGVDYYMEYANVPDANIVVNSNKDKKAIDTWLTKQLEEKKINDYEYNNLIALSDKSVEFKSKDKMTTLESKGSSLYIGKLDIDYNKVFSEDGKTFSLKKGEIGISTSLMEKNNLTLGDTVYIPINQETKPFVIKEKMKDAAFGSDMVGMSRLIVSDEDYDALLQGREQLGLYYVDTNHYSSFSQAFNNQAYSSVINVVSSDMYQLVYSFDMIMAALLILVGICLILIALLVLRFTLVFTMEEQYQEIGIMKAIGFKNFAIKKLYLIKYLAIVLVGATLGLLISFPISNIMIAGISKNIIMASSSVNLGVNVVCALFVVLLVLGFCYFCTRRLNKVSAITAIRGGDTGEKFTKAHALSLAKRSHLPVSIYLGLNDILSHLKRYAVLIITFGISFILITIPLNTLNTMKSDEMLSKFVLNPDSEVCVRNIEGKNESKYTSETQLVNGAHRLKNELKEKGYDASITMEAIYFLKYDDGKQNIMSIQILGDKTDFARYDEGKAPILENEIAFSKEIMDSNDWVIGDHVKATINGLEKDMIITGSYSDYMQLGRSARLNGKVSCDQEIMFDYWSIMVDMESELSNKELANTLQQQFSDYEWVTSQELVDQNIGGIQDILSQMLWPMTAMLCGVIMLITLLMEKLFITREKGEIAMMKSIGFGFRTICKWQIVRMIFVALASLLVSIPLSISSNYWVLKPIFAVMGADVSIQVDSLQVYLLYPGILIIGIIVATLIATRGIRRIDIREMNNLE